MNYRKTPSRRYPAIIMFWRKRNEIKESEIANLRNTVSDILRTVGYMREELYTLRDKVFLLENPPAHKILDRVEFLRDKDVCEGVVMDYSISGNELYYKVAVKSGKTHYVSAKDIMVNHEEVLAKRKAREDKKGNR